MNISQAAAASGLPAKTIRYYDEIGLISPDRRGNGYRNFNAAHLHTLAFLSRARSLGFSIEECRSLISLYDNKARASADVKALAEQHLTQIEGKLAELKAMHDTLSTLTQKCQGNNRPDCPILEGLAGTDQPII